MRNERKAARHTEGDQIPARDAIPKTPGEQPGGQNHERANPSSNDGAQLQL